MNAIAIGEQLKTAREARGLSIDYVADETNIAKRYIAAMESEDFSIFPGEPYIVGFLRNYAEYLGLESASIVQAFRGIRIQEQPVPIQELLQPKRAIAWPFLLAGAVVALGAAGFLAVRAFGPRPEPAAPTLTRSAPVQHTLDSAQFEKRLYEGDTLLVPYLNDSYKLNVSKIDDRVAIETPVGVTRFMLGEEGSIDLDKDNLPELFVFIVDFQKNDPSSGAVIRFKASEALAGFLPSASSPSPGPSPTPGQPTQAIAPGTPGAAPSPSAGAQATAASERPSTQESIVFSGKRSPYPFVVNVTFRNYAMFRHEIDRKEREERYYNKGDQISVTANNSAKLWASNAAACKLTIQASGGQSADVELGSPGEVAVKQVRWVQSDDGSWSLGVYDVN
ncbi:MAG: helix-turn-helix domain-containing protein [Spirochaetes bacterium]|nr:helix-turn-helix domain-containing protein [Spirochaetota bacterium]MBU1081214.1 helix-turn-helix domain-containing protein [Spirochaetota bacterium]